MSAPDTRTYPGFGGTVGRTREDSERLRALTEAFDAAAWSNMVYPLDNRTPLQKFNEIPPQQRPAPSSTRRFLPGGQTVHRSTLIPLIADRAFRISVRARYTATDEGVLFAIGEVFGGMTLFIEDGMLHFTYNGFGQYTRLAPASIPAGAQAFAIDYQALGQRTGQGRLMIDGAPCTLAAGQWTALSPTVMGGFHEGLDIGLDRRAPVDWSLYQRRRAFRYSGTIIDLTIESGAFAPGSAYAKG